MDKVDQLLAVRKFLSSQIFKLKVQRSESPYAAERLTSTLDGMEQNLADLDKEIEEARKEDAAMAKTRSRPDAV